MRFLAYIGVIISIMMHTVSSTTWMYLGMVSSNADITQKANLKRCYTLPGMTEDRLQLCLAKPQMISSIKYGARMGILECYFQFEFERWNCSMNYSNETVFNSQVQKGTREMAFVHAITSAGVVHSVTTKCSSGNVTDCTCDISRQGQTTEEGWQWGGCSDNVDYGIWFTARYIDGNGKETVNDSDDTHNIKQLAHQHNNDVGRKMIAALMRFKCRCHGISGSCAVKTCWKSLPSFRDVGNNLKRKYENSVELYRMAKQHKRLRHLGRRKRYRRDSIPENELVYVEKSPNYCRHNPKRGILGTRGRQCKRFSDGPDSCESLCCGRGYHVEEIVNVERCHCRFVWCCEVKCKICENRYERYTCK